MVTLFASALVRHPDGSFWIETGVECGRVTVEDAPFTAVGLTIEGKGESQLLSFQTNVGDSVAAGAQHPIRIIHDSDTGNPSPYVEVRNGLEALISRPVYYELVELGEERDGPDGRVVGVWSGGCFFPLGSLEAA